MKTVIGVKFKDGGKMYYFDPGEFEIKEGDGVIVETARGTEYGDVVAAPQELEDNKIVAPLKGVVRVATQYDREQRDKNRAKESEAYAVCTEKIQAHKLDMKLVDVEYTFNGSKVVFYFTADGRVDFRELVKDLASVFKTRIELRQIGVRDEAKMLGGLGSCGRPVCCKAFLPDFAPVSIKMAKEQNLALSPTKISGICGRLMCCLKYEQDAYESMRKQMPRTGRDVITPDGTGTVLENNVITERTRVKVILPDGSYDVCVYPFRELRQKNAPLTPKQGDDAENAETAEPVQDGAVNAQTTAAPSGDAAAERRPRRPQRTQQRRPIAAEQGAQKQDIPAAPAHTPAAKPQGDAPQAQTRPEGSPGRRRGSRGGRRRNKGNAPRDAQQQAQNAPKE